ncbi:MULTISPECIES: alpha-amylase family glycosyl hydrolase [unclassified Oceanispirochaeta]|uniref:alpha-amylase family glycosyl hydrolase n=1 Tax=unclassified Oceanispirochaeta TaxID=2635722 RepID=UPI000E09D84A|nr:alpha-amylase family glycosyl hydrolase [Oceanispirochaeta sp. M1]MBF9015267.1 alpha-amylase [Oceanispirochaeta sp. M2]NPD71725.1 alpha-amylase [Oceanispirochaeta sp. M1]RDG32918.1 alpha-amylase [Oceanispirochaeta sp. M1]
MIGCLYLEKSIRDSLPAEVHSLSQHRFLTIQDQSEARQLAVFLRKAEYVEETVKAGELYLTGLLTDFYRTLIDSYMVSLRQTGADISLGGMIPTDDEYSWNAFLKRLDKSFPVQTTGDLSSPPEILEKRIIDSLTLKLLNSNMGCRKLKKLFSDTGIKGKAYNNQLTQLELFIKKFPVPSEWKDDLISLLKAPEKKFPDSLEEQIRFISSSELYSFISDKKHLLSGLDLMREDSKIGLSGPGPVEGIDFSFHEDNEAHFSIDSDWMPNLILIAKNCYVWLYQLTQKYSRPVETLNDIPSEELDELRRRGITGLWLIGIWERSVASKSIKRICGNPEAEASAYSLMDYRIADDLGGEEALAALRDRCLQKGIRLASDMVPNHTGLDSVWMQEHPEYFLQLPEAPFPNYSFEGPDLSSSPDISLFLEEGYYNRSDAAVVFLRKDNKSGGKKYIYHGNDGTSMPWNDTAQLDFLNPEVREELIHQILLVAEKFPIIRFDAAMTLARKHVQRLWFPKPGDGGAIPSRSAYSMSEKEFREKMPEEFWREVVDRINTEAPNTLLLAEAFWMMEGYFVRNLGMHRVYNSAFMNLLKTESNSEFRKILKETLKSNPRILKRFVNFMNNPDEDTAVTQFGKGDKYFGICTLMVTLPGLPMIGHGQMEGLTEKYGMEYRRAYFNEEEDRELLDRHEREIYPLMKKRLIFAGAKQFHLFDYIVQEKVNEDVYAFCNSRDQDQVLVFYNNSNTLTEGRIFRECTKAVNSDDGERLDKENNDIATLMDLNETGYTVLFEAKKRLWYIHRNLDLIKNGLPVKLYGYQSKVFSPIRHQEDDEERRLEKLKQKIGDRGVPDLDRALRYSELEPLIHMMKTFMASRVIDTAVMSDLITMFSRDLNKIRKILNQNKKPVREEQKLLEDIIRPSFMSLMLCELNDTSLFYMTRFYQLWTEEKESSIRLWNRILQDEDFAPWLGINRYKDILWYNKESMDEAFWWFSILSTLRLLNMRSTELSSKATDQHISSLSRLQCRLGESEYRLSHVLDEDTESMNE